MKRILFVDDDQDILDSIFLLLTERGYEVETLLTPKNIFSLIHRFTPDLILLDIKMEEYNGLEICKAVKSYYSTQKIPVIILSGDESISQFKSYDADDFIVKPFNTEMLLEKVGFYLDGPAESARNTG